MSKSLSNAYHNLSLMLASGVPIKRCFEAAAKATKGKEARAFNAVSADVMKGMTVQESMAQYEVFSQMDIMIVDAGEQSGKLAECVKQLSEWHGFVYKLRRTVRSGMVLPVLILHIAAPLIQIPKVALGGASISEGIFGIVKTLMVFYVPLIITVLIVKFAGPESAARAILDKIAMRIPLLGKAMMAMALARFTRAFSTLYSAGVPITVCAKKAVSMTGNEVVRRQLAETETSVMAGDEMWKGFSSKLPPELIESWQVGEESGELDKVSQRLAKVYQDKAEFLFEQFAEWLPKVAYAIVAIIMIINIFKGFGAIYGGIIERGM